MMRAIVISFFATVVCLLVPVVLGWAIDRINRRFGVRITDETEFSWWSFFLFLIIYAAVINAGGQQ